jgi:phosphopantetheine adenylyltransferase
VAKEFFPNIREEKLLNRLDSSKDHFRDQQLQQVRNNLEELSNRLAQKLIDERLVVTSNKKELVRQISICCNELLKADDFDINYRVAPFRSVVSQPNIISLFITAYVVETLVNNSFVEDVYGTDEEIYEAVHSVVSKFL